MKNVAFVIPSLVGGGAERIVSSLANELSNRSYKVTILLLKDSKIDYQLSNSINIINNKDVSVVGQIKFIRNYFIKNDDVAIAFMTYPNLYMLIATIGLKNKKIISERDDPKISLEGKQYLNGIRNIIYKLSDRIVFQTKDARDYYPQYLRKKGTIILNPLRNSLPEVYKGKRDKRIVTVARLTEKKNYPLLLKAFSKFTENYLDYILEIYGVGEKEQELKNLCEKLEISSKVFFKGFISNVLEDIKSAKIFILPSNFEGMPNSLMEAMAMGLPCISTNWQPGGVETIINNKVNGLIVERNNEQQMLEAMNYIVSNENVTERLSNEAQKLRNIANIETICYEWERIIND